ncbi:MULTISPECIES: DUF1488 family protein [Bradyrhizobium]|uniref:DUF1488 family protein n=1 Tax=Bradyrhizobium japonicum TaxID=375 RepID=UPI0009B7CA54
MFNGVDRIVCRVEWPPLRDLAAAEGADPNDIVGTFRRQRFRIEQIASDQHDAGKERPVVRAEHLARATERP